jgi:DNA-3-methyladenine glycosylase II
MERSAFELEPVPPFRLDLTVWILCRRPDNVVDRWDGQTYRRVLVHDGVPVEAAVRQLGAMGASRLAVELAAERLPPGAEERAGELLARMLGIQVDLTGFYRLAAGDPRLGRLVERFRGAKPTRYPTVFEALVNAIACQQVTLTLGIQILNRLALAHGLRYEDGDGSYPAFPRPADLAGLEPAALRALGFSRQKAQAILSLAEGVVAGDLCLDDLERLDDAAAEERLRALRGVGRWTAEYVLLRALGRLHVFPGDDVGGQRNLRRWLGLDEPLSYDRVRAILEPWRAYGGLLYYHLLLQRLAERGVL